MSPFFRHPESGLAVRIPRLDISLVLHEEFHHLDISGDHRPHQGCRLFPVPRIHIRSILKKIVSDLGPLFYDRPHESGLPVPVSRIDIGAVLKKRLDSAYVPVDDRKEKVMIQVCGRCCGQ